MFDRASTFGEALDNPAARAVLERYLPGIAASPMATQFREGRLGSLVAFVPTLEDPAERERLWAALADIGDGAGREPYAPGIDPARAEAVRADTLWGEHRTLRSALMFTPPDVLAKVDDAVRAATT